MVAGGRGRGLPRFEGELPGVLVRRGGDGARLVGVARVLLGGKEGSRGKLGRQLGFLCRHCRRIFLLCYERALAFNGSAGLLIPMTNPSRGFAIPCRAAAA